MSNNITYYHSKNHFMKIQHLILAGSIVLATSCGSSRTTTSDMYSTSNAAIVVDVPVGIQTDFTARYPAASTVTWSRYNDVTVPIAWELTDWRVLGDRDYVVRYSMDNRNYYSWYDFDGNWIGSTYMVSDFSTLPSTIRDMISASYSGYTISTVHNVFWKNMNAYEIELKNADSKVKLLVDANGNVLKKKTKSL